MSEESLGDAGSLIEELFAEFAYLLSGGAARDAYIRENGYFRADDPRNAGVIRKLVETGPWVEVGSGTGALAREIAKAGGRIVATDAFHWGAPDDWYGRHFRTYKTTAQRVAKLIGKFPSVGLLLCWSPPEDSCAYEAASGLAIGQWLAYIGEHRGGTCAADDFFDLLDRDFKLESVQAVARLSDGDNDNFYLYRRVK